MRGFCCLCIRQCVCRQQQRERDQRRCKSLAADIQTAHGSPAARHPPVQPAQNAHPEQARRLPRRTKHIEIATKRRTDIAVLLRQNEGLDVSPRISSIGENAAETAISTEESASFAPFFATAPEVRPPRPNTSSFTVSLQDRPPRDPIVHHTADIPRRDQSVLADQGSDFRF